MQVIYDIGRIKPQSKPPVLAIGVFDGVHLGHRYLLGHAVKRAKALGTKALVMTFFPHPAQVLHSKSDLSLLISLKHRLHLLKKIGVDICLVISFTKAFSRLSAEDFMKIYLKKRIQPQEIFVGHDFRFGKSRKGDDKLLKMFCKNFHCKVKVIHACRNEGHIISSTYIRELIKEGNLPKANTLLGRPVSVCGKVIYGDRRGKILGFPTANLDPSGLVLPPLGIYLAFVRIGKKNYLGMASLGTNPTFKKTKTVCLEVHLLDFKRNLYGKEIEIQFLKKIRNEKRFSSNGQLIAQLHKDEKLARRFFRHFKPHSS